jgi:hypothetical protein
VACAIASCNLLQGVMYMLQGEPLIKKYLGACQRTRLLQGGGVTRAEPNGMHIKGRHIPSCRLKWEPTVEAVR